MTLAFSSIIDILIISCLFTLLQSSCIGGVKQGSTFHMLLFGSHYHVVLAWMPSLTLSSSILSKLGYLHDMSFICYILGMLYGFDAAPEQ